MPNSMLDGISLAEVAELDANLNQKLLGPDGRDWLRAYKRFLRKEDPWLEDAPPIPAQPMWRKISNSEIEVDLDVPPDIRVYTVRDDKWPISAKSGKVLIKAKGTKLFQDDIEIILYLDPSQKVEDDVRGGELLEKLKNVPGHLHPNVLDALLENTHLIPKSWKKMRWIFAWGVGSPYLDGRLCVTGLNCPNGVDWRYGSSLDDYGWKLWGPAAVLAS